MSNIIAGDIITAFRHYALYAAVSGAFILLFLIFILKVLHQALHHNLEPLHHNKRINFFNKCGNKLIIAYILYIYAYHVVCITYFSREPGSRDGFDWGLFSTFSERMSENIYPVENILLFIPLGILLPYLWFGFRRIICCAAAGLFFSLIIEICQFITKRGYFQIDDIITNCAGTILGYGVFAICKLLLDSIKNKKMQ